MYFNAKSITTASKCVSKFSTFNHGDQKSGDSCFDIWPIFDLGPIFLTFTKS